MRRVAAALLLFAVLTAIHTWPLVTDPLHISRLDNADAQLNMWIVCWVAHSLVTDPANLFNANIFYPEPNSLAFSEPLVVPGLIAAPLRWAGAGPPFVYNILLMLGFVLTAFGMYVLTYALTRDQYAALLAGSLAAFNTHLFGRLPHLQAFYMAGVPLAVWALHRFFERKRIGYAIVLALCVAATGWTSGYAAVLCLCALGVAMLVRPEKWSGPELWAVIPRLTVAAGVAIALLGPVLLANERARNEQGLTRSLQSVARYSATPASYALTTGTVHAALWSHWFEDEDREGKFFPGFVPILLALSWLVHRSAWRDWRTRFFAALAVLAFLLSLGTATPLYPTLYGLLAPLQAMRAVNRFGYLVILAVAGLAALGLARLRARYDGRRWATAAALALILVANGESFRAPYPYVPFEGFSPVYRRLAEDPGPAGAVAEFPFPRVAVMGRNAEYMLASTEHWRPLLNGYSGFRPDTYRETARALRDFPDRESLALLRARGVTHVVVHLGEYGPRRAKRAQRRLARLPEFELLAEDDERTRLYRLWPDGVVPAARP